VLYFLEVTTAAFVALTLADLADVPERRFGLVLALAIAVAAGALAWAAEASARARDRRAQASELHRREAAAERRRLVARARA
jgi:hypothetical protein